MSKSETAGSDSSASEKTIWQLFGQNFPRKEIVFFTQVILLYIVITTCLVNLTLHYQDNSKSQLWIALLTGCLGYILPHPSLEAKRSSTNCK